MFRVLATLTAMILALPALAAQAFSFGSIDGGDLNLESYRGQPVLVVNTDDMDRALASSQSGDISAAPAT